MKVELTSPTTPPTSPEDLYMLSFSDDSTKLITNVDTTYNACHTQHTDDESISFTLPTTINQTEYENSYVCSPYTALVPYCSEELAKLKKPWLELLLRQLIKLLDGLLRRYKINQVVHINNWLLSTNLYPDPDTFIKKRDPKNSIKHSLPIADIIRQTTNSFPTHGVIFRSLNRFLNAELMEECQHAGCILVPTRQVYLYHKTLRDYSQTHNYKIDKKLLEKTPYQYVAETDINESDYERIIELYNMLYIDKHSNHNPQFTTNYIKMIIKHPYFYLEGYRNKNGILDAIGGRFTIGSTTSLPIVGYDISKPKKLGLYRLVLMSTLLYAEREALCFHVSSGAPHFKRLRGAVPYIEYSAVYINHLSPSTQRFWRILSLLLNKIFTPIIKRYQL